MKDQLAHLLGSRVNMGLFLDQKKVIDSYFRGTEKVIKEDYAFEGIFHFDLPKGNCVEELTGKIYLKIEIPPGFPIEPPRAFIKDRKLFIFPHLRMSDGQICPPDFNTWKKATSIDNGQKALEGFFHYLTDWFIDAALGKLLKPEDDYELPDFPATFRTIFVFFNNENELKNWLSLRESKIGVCSLEMKSSLLILKKFDKSENEFAKGIYVWFPEEPVLRFKNPPLNFCELEGILNRYKLSLDNLFSTAVKNNILESFFFIIGFPIKEKNQNNHTDIFWQAAYIDFNIEKWKRKLLANSKKSFRKRGIKNWRKEFRRQIKKINFVAIAKERFLNYLKEKEVPIAYLNSFDCTEKYLYSRIGGQSNIDNFLIFGCGAIGSNLAAQFARSGCKRLALCDYERIEPGNICRHFLDFDSINKQKASEMVNALKRINPWGDYKAFEFDLIRGLDQNNFSNFDTYSFWIDAGLPPGVSEYLSFRAKVQHKRLVSAYITINAEYFIVNISGKVNTPSIEAIEKHLIEISKKQKGDLEKCIELLNSTDGQLRLKPNKGCYFLTFAATGAQMSQIASILFNIISEVITVEEKIGKVFVYKFNKSSYIYELIFKDQINS